jgi:hypothetical protein
VEKLAADPASISPTETPKPTGEAPIEPPGDAAPLADELSSLAAGGGVA